jgi:hypothetical protein
VLARKRVVPVDGDVIIINFDDANRYRTLFCTSLKLHTHFERFYSLKTVTGYYLFERRVGLAVAILRSDAHF